MHLYRRVLIVCLLAGTMAGTAFDSVAQGAFAVSKWEAGTCKESSCTDAGPTSAFYTQAAGHPDFGITDFEFSHTGGTGLFEHETPEGKVKDVRVDLPPGLAVNPEATKAQCTDQELEADEEKCPAESEVGEDEATGTAELTLGVKTTVTEDFPVYNMVRNTGEPARFGVEVNSATLRLVGLQSYIYLEGGISWHHEAETSENSGVASGDFHEFFKIQNIPTQPEIIESRLEFWGVPEEHTGIGTPAAFLTLPSTCTSKPITYLHVDSYEDPGHFLAYANETPVAATGCGSLELSPSLSLAHGMAEQSEESPDKPDGAGVVLSVPQYTTEPSRPNSPDIQTAEVTLPEGMTLNPSAANGLKACTSEEVGLGTNNPITCPEASDIGTLEVDAPGIPNGSLKGNIYLANQESQEPESGKEFRIFLSAESTQYGVGLRLEGQVKANKQTGQLTATVDSGPEVPFEAFVLNFKSGPLAPLANPLICAAAAPAGALTPYTGEPASSVLLSSPFSAGAGSVCSSSAPFSLAQNTQSSNSAAGAYNSFTLNLTREDGQQYLGKVSTTLPEGLLAAIPSVALCGEGESNAGTCGSASQIGTATVQAGSGPDPYSLSGPVFLTGPYDGAPYGLSIPVDATAGPFDLGTVVTRAAITVNPTTARLTVSTPAAGAAGALPTIVGGVPVRLRSISIAVNKSNFLFNPTNCGALATETTLTSTSGTTQSLPPTAFQVSGCGSLAFKPTFSASTQGNGTQKGHGASLTVKLTSTSGQANLHEAAVDLPTQLPTRLSTLNLACTEAAFNADPVSCPRASQVGHATVSTPVLPDRLAGFAYLVSHGGAAFPDLELILNEVNAKGEVVYPGIQVILDGKTDIKKDVTSSTFSSIPDVPISSFELNLPEGPDSVLSATGNLCAKPLVMPTTLIGQNGTQLQQNTKIAVSGCKKAAAKVKVVKHRVKGHTAILTVKVPAAGRVSASAGKVRRVTKKVAKAKTVTLEVKLSGAGVAALDRKGTLKVKIRVGFIPKKKGATSKAFATVKFKR